MLSANIQWLPIFYLVCYPTDGRLHQRQNVLSYSAQSTPKLLKMILQLASFSEKIWIFMDTDGQYSKNVYLWGNLSLYFLYVTVTAFFAVGTGNFVFLTSINQTMRGPLGYCCCTVLANNVSIMSLTLQSLRNIFFFQPHQYKVLKINF